MALWMTMSNWTPSDVAWDRFEPSLVDPDIVKLVKAASMVEYNARNMQPISAKCSPAIAPSRHSL
ncbi:MAG: hypothetical protein ACLPWS_23095 [Rhodomicrobium sp.]